MKNTATTYLISGITHLAAIIVVCISFAADKLPDRIILTWTDSPATTQTVTWRTDMSVNSAVAQIAVATDNSHRMQSRTVEAVSTPFSSEYGNVKYHQADFTELRPNTLYAYRVGDGENWSEWFHFRTASTEPRPFSFIYFGDAQADIKTYWSRVFHEAFKDAPRAVFTLHAGDQVNRAENDEQWGEWFDAPGWVNASVPVIATPGNHEYFYEGRGEKENRKWNTKKGKILEIHTTEEAIPDGSGEYIKATAADGRKGTITLDSKGRIVAIDKGIQQITGFKPADLAGEKPNASQLQDRYSEPGNPRLSSFWQLQFSFPLNGPEEVKETCYYIDYQGARIIVLNSNEYQEKQAEWLRGVLRNNQQRWTIVTFHHPVFSPTIGRDNPELRNLLKPIFDEFSVDMVLTGHDHTYARAIDNETVYVVSVSGPKLYNIDRQDWMIRAAEQIQLYQVIQVDPWEIRYESRTATGRLNDAFVIKKQKDEGKKILELLPSELQFTSCAKQAVIEEIIVGDSWYISSSEKMNSSGGRLTTSGDFTGAGWTKAIVPSTVLGALTQAGIYEDAFFAMNLEDIPAGQFKIPWWYCTTFALPSFDIQKEQVQLYLDGINYRANVWLNGQQIISADTAFGAFRQFACDITDMAKAQGNKLAIEIIPPEPGDFYIGFVDWAPVPPDHNMGVYRQVRVKRSGKVSIKHPFITTDVNLQTLKDASLTIATDMTNYSNEQKNVTLEASIENITVRRDWILSPGQMITAKLTPEKYKELIIQNPRLWWPSGLGNPEMYTLKLTLKEGNILLDSISVRFGIRTVSAYMNVQGVRGYKVNGREVLIKSAGWVDDLFLRNNTRSNKAQIRYVKEMNLNSLRFEGFWGTSQEIYDLCDENGILLMVGWSCQWEWPDYLGLRLEVPEEDENIPINEGVDKYGVKLSSEEETLFSDMFRDQVIWLRNHPSVFVWAVGSDAMPKPSLERKYMKTLEEYDMSRSLLVSAGEFTSEISGKTGMKMNGPYEYVPPVYWYEDKKLGGAFGFNTETGPGPQIPPIQSIKRMMPEESLWPPLNEMWDFHSGRKDFNSVKVYLNAMNKRYGEPKNLEELAMKAQWMNYESIRPMFEAFVVNRPVATGVVQWQLNSAWPEFYWQVYDWYLMPTGAYFGTKKSCQPIHILYNYYDRKIYVANDVIGDLSDMTASVNLYDSRSDLIYEHKEKISVKENTSLSLAELPKLTDKTETYFLKLELTDSNQKLLADNFYWLSGQEDIMDWATYYWFYTPQKTFADFKKLNSLTKAQVGASKKVKKENGEWVVEVTLNNTGKNIAFCIEMMLVDASTGEPVLPVFWDDNYVSLIKDENRTFTVRCSGQDTLTEPSVIIQGVNIDTIKR